MSASKLDYALALASKQFEIFQIKPDKKKPRQLGWPGKATTNFKTIEDWWSKHPDDNIGIHCNSLIVVDIDGPIGFENARTLELPRTYKSLSGNIIEPHHFQLFYRLPEEFNKQPKNNPLCRSIGYEHCDKIDIKTGGGQVVGPGSTHHTGGTYRWEVEPEHISSLTAAPQWLLDLCVREKYVWVPKNSREAGSNSPCTGRPSPTHNRYDSDDDWLKELHYKFPITESGTRNVTVLQAQAWLFSRLLPVERITKLMASWLNQYDDVYSTPKDQVLQELYATVGRTSKAIIDGKFELPLDHRQLTADQQLLPIYQQLMNRLTSVQTSQYTSVERSDRETFHDRISVPLYRQGRLSGGQIRLLECLLLHIQYEPNWDNDKLLLTNRQLIAIHEKRFGKSVTFDTIIRFLPLFTTRIGASGEPVKCKYKELLILEQSGSIGHPSVYKPSKLLMEN